VISITKHNTQISEQLHAQAGLCLLAGHNKGNSSLARLGWPFAAGQIGNRDKRLPYIGIPVLYLGWHLRPADRLNSAGPDRDTFPEPLTFRCMKPSAILLNPFALGAALHSNDNRPRQDGVGQPSETGQRDRAESRYLLGLDRLALDHTAANKGAATMARINQRT